jgi:putative endonuclease
MREYYVYILCNESGTLYTGMTNDLNRRAYEHRHQLHDGFTKRYNVCRVVYYETYADVREAIAREKQIKAWRRSKKLDLIRSLNPYWRDLTLDWDDLQAHPEWGQTPRGVHPERMRRARGDKARGDSP